jgi:hypothetical protein
MKKKVAKKKILISLVVFLGSVGIFVAIIVYLFSLQTKSKEKYDWLKNDISSKERKIRGLSDQALEFAEAISVWEEFDEETKLLGGIRINSAKNVIEALEKKYRLSDFTIVFSKPEMVDTSKKPEYKNELINVSASTVAIDFGAATDDIVYNFVSELMEKFPGYITINAFSVNRVRDVETEDLEKLAAGENVTLVNVKVRFDWRDFKYNPPIENSPTENGEDG